MKQFMKKFIAIVSALAVFTGMCCFGTFAEEAVSEPVQVEEKEEVKEEATEAPTKEPTAEPTKEPTPEPTEEPTAVPTEEPTAVPTEEPSEEVTEAPAEEAEEETTEAPEEVGSKESTVEVEISIKGDVEPAFEAGTEIEFDTKLSGEVIGKVQYAWEIKYADAYDWAEIENKHEDTLKIKMTDEMNDAKIRAVISDIVDGEVVRTAVAEEIKLVLIVPAVTEEPIVEEIEEEPTEEIVEVPAAPAFEVTVEVVFSSAVPFEGDEITLVSTIVGTAVNPQYQWQAQIDGMWTDIEGATEKDYTFVLDAENGGIAYRVVVNDETEMPADEPAEQEDIASEEDTEVEETV